MRRGGPLPWDNDFDMMLFYEEINTIDETEFYKKFHDRGIEITYRYWKGEYVVHRNGAHGDIMIFKEYWTGERGRIGIEPWLFFVHFKYYHQAPARLFVKPLPKLRFAGIDFSVPKDGLEIQKRFYPHDWWKEVKPKGC